jgi:hypothetical protein
MKENNKEKRNEEKCVKSAVMRKKSAAWHGERNTKSCGAWHQRRNGNQEIRKKALSEASKNGGENGCG